MLAVEVLFPQQFRQGVRQWLSTPEQYLPLLFVRGAA